MNTSVKISIPVDKYKSVTDLVNACTVTICQAKLSANISVKHLLERGKIAVDFEHVKYEVRFSKHLAELLGFILEIPYGGKYQIIATNKVNIEGRYAKIYV